MGNKLRRFKRIYPRANKEKGEEMSIEDKQATLTKEYEEVSNELQQHEARASQLRTRMVEIQGSVKVLAELKEEEVKADKKK
jgi:hypothetical protein